MSLFGYPASVTHHRATVDSWGRVVGYTATMKKAKVVEQQKLIRNGKGEEIQSIAEIHLEGKQDVSPHDYFEYTNGIGQKLKYTVKHIEVRKHLGTDDVKKVVVYA